MAHIVEISPGNGRFHGAMLPFCSHRTEALPFRSPAEGPILCLANCYFASHRACHNVTYLVLLNLPPVGGELLKSRGNRRLV
jgi:hypothetical protein